MPIDGCRASERVFLQKQAAFAMRLARNIAAIGSNWSESHQGGGAIRSAAWSLWPTRWASEQTFSRREKRFAGIGIGELRRLRALEEENSEFKQLAADPSLDRKMLQDVLSKNDAARGAVSCTAGGKHEFLPREEADNLPCFPRDIGKNRKAGEGTRTLDIQLGKLALYQLSYARDRPKAGRTNRRAIGCVFVSSPMP